MKVASMLLVYNGEKFIKPHLDMLCREVDKVLVVLPDRPFRQYSHVYGKPDRTEKIIRTLYPDVEVAPYTFDDGEDASDYPQAWNFGLSKLQEYDIITTLFVDSLMIKDDFSLFINTLRNGDNNVYRLDFSKWSPDYYGDWDLDHGVMDQREKDPIAIPSHTEVPPYYNIPLPSVFLDGLTLHHFRNWKSKEIPEGPYIQAPKEIKDVMYSWREELKGI